MGTGQELTEYLLTKARSVSSGSRLQGQHPLRDDGQASDISGPHTVSRLKTGDGWQEARSSEVLRAKASGRRGRRDSAPTLFPLGCESWGGRGGGGSGYCLVHSCIRKTQANGLARLVQQPTNVYVTEFFVYC